MNQQKRELEANLGHLKEEKEAGLQEIAELKKSLEESNKRYEVLA